MSEARGTLPLPPAPSPANNLRLGIDLSSAAHPNGVRMLIAKHRGDDSYPLTGVQLDPTLPTLRPRMRIGGFVVDAATGAPPTTDRTIYLSLRDPADTAPYVVREGHAHVGDNKDPAAQLSTMDGRNSVSSWDCAGAGCGTPLALAVRVPAGSGRFEAILTGTRNFAGDNYRIEASTQRDMTCRTAANCSSSAVITAWKRVYVEVNKMARKGAQLTRPAQVGATELFVSDVRHFPDAPFKILLLHAPPANSLGGDFYTEEHSVERLEGKKLFSFYKPEPGKLILKEGETVRQPFLGPERVRVGLETPTTRAYLADAVMWFRNDRARDYFTPDLSRVAALFNDAFVETVWLTDDAQADGAPTTAVTLPHDGYVPYFEAIVGDNEREWVARKWMRNATRYGSDRTAEENHQVLFAAWNQTETSHTRGGATKVANGFNDMWTFAKNFEGNHPGKLLAHELAHQWRTNQGNSPVFGAQNPAARHCDEKFRPPGQPNKDTVLEYTGNEACLMNSDIGIIPAGKNNHVLFHYIVSPTLAVDSEYVWIRERAEPVPQNEEMDRDRILR